MISSRNAYTCLCPLTSCNVTTSAVWSIFHHSRPSSNMHFQTLSTRPYFFNIHCSTHSQHFCHPISLSWTKFIAFPLLQVAFPHGGSLHIFYFVANNTVTTVLRKTHNDFLSCRKKSINLSGLEPTTFRLVA
jgi:hypothetical protein